MADSRIILNSTFDFEAVLKMPRQDGIKHFILRYFIPCVFNAWPNYTNCNYCSLRVAKIGGVPVCTFHWQPTSTAVVVNKISFERFMDALPTMHLKTFTTPFDHWLFDQMMIHLFGDVSGNLNVCSLERKLGDDNLIELTVLHSKEGALTREGSLIEENGRYYSTLENKFIGLCEPNDPNICNTCKEIYACQ